LLAAGISLLAGTAAGAENAATLRSQASSLQAQNASLDAQARQVLLDLYALESKLRRSDRTLTRLKAQAGEVARQERSTRRALAIARQSEQHAQQALQDRVRALYIEGDTDPLAVILGARSLDDVISAIDSVNRLASNDQHIIDQVHATRRDLRDAATALLRREAELGQLAREAKRARDALARTRDEKSRYLDRLAAERALNSREIERLTGAAAAAEQKAAAITEAAAADTPAAAPQTVASTPGSAPASAGDESPAPGRQVTVSATMYCLTGTTATGIPVAPGVVATDPAYIPLGTQMYIPGYGDGVAADTGGAVRGWTIDLWVVSCNQADSFGRQTITITIYS
jgi:3D (Asp-Asp-Asp) domain-containing protein